MTYKLTIQKANKEALIKPPNIFYTLNAKNLASRLNLSFIPIVRTDESLVQIIKEKPFSISRSSKNNIYKFYNKVGYTREDCDRFIVEADKYIKEGKLTYLDLFGVFNMDAWGENHYNKGIREGKKIMLPENLKGKNVAQIVIDSFDTKNTCQYFNAHKSYLLKSYDEAIAMGLFKDYYCSNIFCNELGYIFFKLEDYYFNPELRFRKDKILRWDVDERNISMDETKKGE